MCLFSYYSNSTFSNKLQAVNNYNLIKKLFSAMKKKETFFIFVDSVTNIFIALANI